MAPVGSTAAVREPVDGGEEVVGDPTAGGTDTDAHLALHAAAGDAAAFRAIFERHGRAVRRYLGDLFRHPASADEATQETFVRAHRQLGSLRASDRLVSWLLGIARNVYFESRRAERRRARDPVGLRADDRIGEEAVTRLAPVDPAPSPEALLLGREADRVLEHGLRALTDERRAALLLSIDHGLRYEEIAAHMGWPLHKVKNEIHRARQALRARLAFYVREQT